MSRTRRLTEALLADRNRAHADRSDLVECWVCGYSFLYGGRRGELNNNFCSMRCQDWYDASYPAPSSQIDYAVPLRDYVVVAGPPGLEDRDREGIETRASREGFMIRCAHCGSEFESKGLRCCSPKCEAEMCKPAAKRRARRPKIPNYSLKINGRGYWRAGATALKLGFQSVDCGYDGPEAWTMARDFNARVAAAKNMPEMPVNGGSNHTQMPSEASSAFPQVFNLDDALKYPRGIVGPAHVIGAEIDRSEPFSAQPPLAKEAV